MGSVVSESSDRVVVYKEVSADKNAGTGPLTLQELKTLARSIIDKEPSEIRGLLRQEPELVHAWVAQLKTQQLSAIGPVDVMHDALDHIRLSTLSPLKFAAE